MSNTCFERLEAEKDYLCQPGGGVEPCFDRRNILPPPPAVRDRALSCSCDGYRAAVLHDRIPFRPHGLFPPSDSLLLSLAANPACHPFEKHLSGEIGCYELLEKGGWVTGDAGAANGIDLRLFYKEPENGEKHGTIHGAVRFGDRAAIGNGYFMSAHGGSIESALDEATAELSKMELSPLVTTREATFSMTRPVPLHTSLVVSCRVKEQRGIRCYVEGALKSAEDPSAVYATCNALLVDITAWV